MSNATSLSLSESGELDRLEEVIEAGFKTFLEVGQALLKIRDARLYRAGHDTFEGYCRVRWGMGHRYANRIIEAATITESLGPIGPMPVAESQVRPLAPLQPAQQREAWDRAVATAPNGTPTAAHVSSVVAELFPKREPLEGQADLGFDDEEPIEPEGDGATEEPSGYDEPRSRTLIDLSPEWSDSELQRKAKAERGESVLANLRTDHALIAWAKAQGRYVAIDRTAYPYGNPMRITSPGPDRAFVIAWYRDHWLPFFGPDEIDWEMLSEGKVLGCWCYPEPCHGDALLEFLNAPS